MPTVIKHPYTHWVNGMKLSKEHLIGLENSFIDHTRDLAETWLNNINFGLLPTYDGSDSLGIEVSPERIEILHCQAITRGGARIDIPENHNIAALRRPMHEIFSGIESRNTDWYAMLKVNPFQRIPFGPVNAEENPPRHPYSAPSYELSIVSKDEISSPYFDPFAIPVAKIQDDFGGKRADEQYMPPCAGVQSYSLLIDQYRHFGKHTDDIEDSLFEIIKKTQQKRIDQRSNVLATDIEAIATKIIDYFSLHKDSYELLLLYQPPVYVLEWFSRMARVIRSSLRFLQNKDGMLSYFNIYIDKGSSADFQSVIDKTCSIHYNHLDAQSAFKQIEQFLRFLNELFRKLRELKFEAFADPTIVDKVSFPSSGPTTSPPRTDWGGARTNVTITPKGSKKRRDSDESQGSSGWNIEDD